MKTNEPRCLSRRPTPNVTPKQLAVFSRWFGISIWINPTLFCCLTHSFSLSAAVRPLFPFFVFSCVSHAGVASHVHVHLLCSCVSSSSRLTVYSSSESEELPAEEEEKDNYTKMLSAVSFVVVVVVVVP